MTGDRPASPELARVLRGQLCSGCGGCAALAPSKISMTVSPAGYNRPVQTGALTAEEESRFAAICPGVGLKQSAEGRKDHPLWGPLIAVRSGHASDPDLRHNASSGGVLSAVLIHLIETGAVEFVLQVAADPAHPLGNLTVISRTAAEVFAAAGSRYSPSSPLAGLEAHLVPGRRFAFVGKPCDVAALRALARYDSRIDACIPYMISFFCAGIPSLKGAEEIVHKLGVELAQVTAFRYRGDGWPGFATATLTDGNTRRMSYNDSWGGILTGHIQFRCKICPDGTGGFADLVCADAWHCDEAGYPLFDEGDGISLIVSRTAKGENLLASAMTAGVIQAEPLPVAQIAAMQPGQAGRKKILLARLLALWVLFRPRPSYRGFHLGRAACMAGLAKNLRNFLGTGRRILLKRR